MREMRLQIFAEVQANLYVTANVENPLFELTVMRKTKLAEESPEIRKQ